MAEEKKEGKKQDEDLLEGSALAVSWLLCVIFIVTGNWFWSLLAALSTGYFLNEVFD